MDFPSAETLEKIIPSIETCIKKLNFSFFPPVIMASVKTSFGSEVSDLIRKNFGSCTVVTYSDSLPFKVHYRNPHQLGADRIADLLFAFHQYPDDTTIIINAGTAIRVELLDKGIFRGGVIFPGITAQLRSLYDSTDALPDLHLENTWVIPGNSTEECMRGGVLAATAGALNHIVAKYTEQSEGQPGILATGGSWFLLAKEVSFHYTYVADMTLIGSALFGCRGRT